MPPKRRKQNGKKRARPNSQVVRLRNVAITEPIQLTLNSKGAWPYTKFILKIQQADLAAKGMAWAANQIKAYDLYRFTRLSVEWISSLSDLSSGSAGMYFDPSPSAKEPSSFQALSGNMGLKTFKASSSARMDIPWSRMNRVPWYKSAGTDEECCMGAIVVGVSQGQMGNTEGTLAAGFLRIVYDLELKGPTNDVGATAIAETSYPTVNHTDDAVEAMLQRMRDTFVWQPPYGDYVKVRQVAPPQATRSTSMDRPGEKEDDSPSAIEESPSVAAQKAQA